MPDVVISVELSEVGLLSILAGLHGRELLQVAASGVDEHLPRTAGVVPRSTRRKLVQIALVQVHM